MNNQNQDKNDEDHNADTPQDQDKQGQGSPDSQSEEVSGASRAQSADEQSPGEGGPSEFVMGIDQSKSSSKPERFPGYQSYDRNNLGAKIDDPAKSSEPEKKAEDALSSHKKPDLSSPSERTTPAPGPDTQDAAQTPRPQDIPADASARIQELEAQLADFKDKYVRAVAETENMRKRNARERQDISKYAVSSFAKDLLDFSDNFRRAMDSLPAELLEEDQRIKNTLGGIEAMERELLKIFEKHGIQKMEPMDEIFDPNFHEVMFESPGSGKPAGTIVQIIEPGYMLHDRLLRPARVGIAKDDGSSDETPPQGGTNIDEEI